MTDTSYNSSEMESFKTEINLYIYACMHVCMYTHFRPPAAITTTITKNNITTG